MKYEDKVAYLTSLKDMFTDKDPVKELQNQSMINFVNNLIREGKLNKKNLLKSYNSFIIKNKNNEEISYFIQQIEI